MLTLSQNSFHIMNLGLSKYTNGKAKQRKHFNEFFKISVSYVVCPAVGEEWES